jgi:hypothetical protein
MRVIKILAYLFIGFIGIFVIAAVFGGNDREEKQLAMEKKHCALIWETMSPEEKELALNEFIEESGSPSKSNIPLEFVVVDLLKGNVKYPETIIVDEKKLDSYIYMSPSTGSIANVDEGLINYYKAFTAKNKLNMDVRMRMDLQLKYTGGCKGFKLVSFNVE